MNSDYAIRVLLVSAMAISAGGCPSEPETSSDLEFRGGDDDTIKAKRRSSGFYINNGLHDPDVGGLDPSQALAAGGLDGERLDHPDRLATARYVVECALAAGDEVTEQVDGQPVDFEGAVGLAPEWKTEPCDEDCQQWVSACVLARTNVSTKDVTLHLRADHPALGTAPHPDYPHYEASFFGNVFAGPGQEHMCLGPVVGPVFAQLDDRTCSNLVGGHCEFESYLGCELGRCEFDGVLAPTAIDCRPGGLALGPPMHTISTYVAAVPGGLGLPL